MIYEKVCESSGKIYITASAKISIKNRKESSWENQNFRVNDVKHIYKKRFFKENTLLSIKEKPFPVATPSKTFVFIPEQNNLNELLKINKVPKIRN